MKQLFKSIQYAAKDKTIPDAIFRRMFLRTFEDRRHGESFTASFLRNYEVARIEAERETLKRS